MRPYVKTRCPCRDLRLVRIRNGFPLVESGAADLRGKGEIWYITHNKGKSMLRSGMTTLNGKARQTVVTAFARMPDPPPSK